MKSFGNRLKRLEGIVGSAEEKMYLVRVGFRSFDDCMAAGQLFFRFPEGGCHNIKAFHEYCGGRLVNVLDIFQDESKSVLNRLGYEEIKSKEELQSRLEDRYQ